MSSESPFHGTTVVMRAVEPEDASTLHAWFNHSDLLGRRYTPGGVREDVPLSMLQVEEIIQEWAKPKSGTHLMVTLREHQTLVGYAACDWGWDTHAQDVWVVIAPAYRRKGYGSEALRLLLRHQFTCSPAHNISCWVAGWNEAGQLFAKHHGFRESGRIRRAGMREGKFYDLVVADILRPEWEAMCGGEGNAA